MHNPRHGSDSNWSDKEIMWLDVATQEDLNLFGTDGPEPVIKPAEDHQPDTDSLFGFCNYTRSEGGERVLRRRMQEPWATAERIHNTQQALRFIQVQRDAFATLPAAYVAPNAERYTRDSLPIIKDNNRFEFALSAFSLWANEDRFYIRITRGVELTCRLVRTLREFLGHLDQDLPGGELAPLLLKLQNLLETPALDAIPDEKTDRKFWHTLRLDQIFRWREKPVIDQLFGLVYELDALVALTDATSKNGFVFPELENGPVHISASELSHPFLPDAIANPVELDQNKRVLFLTGPNMAGKTTYLRAVATAIYFAHLGMGVPAQRFRFVPVDCLLTAISLRDDINEGVSFFRAEALRVKAVAEAIAAGRKVVAIMDEPFKGTNVKDAFDASVAILERFASKPECLFMVTSHLIEVSEQLDPSLPISYQYFEAQEARNRLRFDFVLHPGVSSQRLGMRVLKEEGIFELLDSPLDSPKER